MLCGCYSKRILEIRNQKRESNFTGMFVIKKSLVLRGGR
jgi:hypothetical protein